MTVSELTEFLEERAGSLLRGIARYDGDSTDVIYLRGDVKKQRMRSEIDRILNRVRPESSAKEERSFPFGDLHATVRAFDDASILHFPMGVDRGIVVSLEPGASQDLNTFVGECLDQIGK